MNKQQIEEWIDANKQLAFVDENHAEHVIPIDKFRSLLKDNAIAPKDIADGIIPPSEVSGRFASEMFWRGVYAMREAMIEASEKGELDE